MDAAFLNKLSSCFSFADGMIIRAFTLTRARVLTSTAAIVTGNALPPYSGLLVGDRRSGGSVAGSLAVALRSHFRSRLSSPRKINPSGAHARILVRGQACSSQLPFPLAPEIHCAHIKVSMELPFEEGIDNQRGIVYCAMYTLCKRASSVNFRTSTASVQESPGGRRRLPPRSYLGRVSQARPENSGLGSGPPTGRQPYPCQRSP